MKQSQTNITLTDITGREVMEMLNANLASGAHTSAINTGKLSKGIYFVKLKSGDAAAIEKLVVQ